MNFLFLGRIHSKKGLIPLIDAMKLAKEEKFNVNLNIVGPESSHCDYLKTVVKKYKIENSVKFLPAVYEMSEKKYYSIKMIILFFPHMMKLTQLL